MTLAQCNVYCDYILWYIDLDYWKPHSRRFYVADRSDFTELTNKKGKSTKHSRKHKYTLFDFTSERKEQRCTCEQMMKSIEKVSDYQKAARFTMECLLCCKAICNFLMTFQE